MPKRKPLQTRLQPWRREQARASPCSPMTIMLHPHFARGLDDIRAGRSFADDVHDKYWAYERGPLFGAIAPSSMPLFDGKRLNPKTVRLFIAARGLIPGARGSGKPRLGWPWSFWSRCPTLTRCWRPPWARWCLSIGVQI